MDESALRALIASLEKQSGPLHSWLHFWTWMVILGCAGELISVIHEHRDDLKIWRKARNRGVISFPERPSGKFLIFELVSVAAVVIGIAGELNIDFRAGRLESQLRDANNKLVLLLGKEAEDAKQSAEGAATAAATAKGLADAAADKVKIVGKEADQIGGTLGMAVGLINARQVDDVNKLAGDLKPRFKGRNIQLVSYVGDVEAWGLCNQLVIATKAAEMIPENICGKAWFTSPLISPLSITATSSDEEDALARIISKHGHLGTVGIVGPNLIVFVGVKSPFIIGETAQTRAAEKAATAMKKVTRKTPKP